MFSKSNVNLNKFSFYTGVAWLSSVRGVNCSVKSFNERNPCFKKINFFFKKLQIKNLRKVRMTSNQHDPYELGY